MCTKKKTTGICRINGASPKASTSDGCTATTTSLAYQSTILDVPTFEIPGWTDFVLVRRAASVFEPTPFFIFHRI
ncbi:hypothetical protein CGCF413_v001468 [Colletotrichum fructicola]|nr:hypothetical protein CGCF413_v001468 [Colletotrichum fructicola]